MSQRIEVRGELSLDGGQWDAALKHAEEGVNHLADTGLDHLKEAIVAVFAEETVRRTLEFITSIKHMAEQTGTTTEEVQRLSYAARDAGLSFENFEGALSKMGKAREEAAEKNDQLLRKFERFGVTLNDLQNPAMRNIDLMYKMGEAARSMELNSGDREALRDLFGRGGDKLAESLAHLSDYKDRPIVSSKDIESIERLERAVNELKTRALTAIAPTLAGAADWASGQLNVQVNKEFLGDAYSYLEAKGNTDGMKLYQRYKDALHYNLDQNSIDRARTELVSELQKTAGDVVHVPFSMFGMPHGDYANPITGKRGSAPTSSGPVVPPLTPGQELFHDERKSQALRDQEEHKRAMAELDQLAYHHAFDLLTTDQKRAELEREIFAMKTMAGTPLVDQKTADQLKIEAAKKQIELDSLNKAGGHHALRAAEHSDSLIRTGNFLGSSSHTLSSVGHEQLQVLREIARNTSPMVKVAHWSYDGMMGTFGVPSIY